MKFERSPMPSPEEMAKIEKERVLSDTEPLKGGAEYKFNEKGEKFLVTEEQIIKETRLEKTVDDLGVYVKLHKEIELPYTEISDENLKSDALLKKGHYFISRHEKKDDKTPSINFIHYITTNGDCATVKIDTTKIDSLKDLIKEDYKPWTDANAVLEEKLEELGFQRSGKAVYSEVSKSLFEENQKNKTNIFNTSVRKVGESFGEGYHNISIIEEYWQNDEEKQFFNKIFEKRSAYAYKLRKEMAQKKKEEFNF